MNKRIFCPLLLLAILSACGEKPENNNTNQDSQSAWSLSGPKVQKVEVSSDGTPLETYAYTYDAQGRLSSLVKTDQLHQETILDLKYSYPDETGMKAIGKFYPVTSSRYITAVRNEGEKTLSYTGSWKGAWSYVTRYDAGGTALATVNDIDFKAQEGWYSAKTHFGAASSVSGGCITRAEYGAEIEAQTRRKTRSSSSTELTVSYSYSDKEDRQNFAVYLFPCDFPVWVAAGLPGCKTLITGISSARGSVQYPSTTKIDYAFNPDGSIDIATRTDYNGSESILVRTYKFSYL